MKKIVVIGGGTGSYTVLRALKNYPVKLTAIVSMFDSGGSTGRLRDEFGYLPTGDVRRCILALAPETADNLILRKLFNYRFDKGNGLSGHSFGNLFLTALRSITGSTLSAISNASEILNIKGKVLPVTLDNCHLYAELEDGTIINGETNIDLPKHNPNLKIKKVFLDKKAEAIFECEKAIVEADIIIIGPGDLYTSIIPNLLVSGISEALKNSSAKKVYICNLMTKNGETHNYSASDHVQEIKNYSGLVDVAICNKSINDEALLKKYEEENAYPVFVDKKKIEELGVELIEENLVSEPILIRHDPDKLAKAIINLLS